MDFAALQFFKAVVDEGGITAAAKRLHRVQSNVTTRIKQLEESLGTQLFVRDKRRLRLTPAGGSVIEGRVRMVAPTVDAATRNGLVYVDLLKPRVMSLVVFTGLIGVLIAPTHIHPFAAALAVIAIALGSGAAGAVNMWYERDLDALMARTRNRPLPAGRVAPDDALGLGVLLSIFSVLLMAVATNFVAAALLAAAILFYVFVYTIWLKRRTPQNIVIGGAAGAFPPMIGWAVATGDVGVLPLILRHVDIKPERLTIVTGDDRGHAEALGAAILASGRIDPA